MTENRNSDGTFGKGNKAAKKDMTKDIARAMVSKELWWVAKLLADVPAKKLNQFMNDNNIELSVIGLKIVEKAMKGDMKSIIWFTELMHGKARQEVETKITEHSIQINIDGDDAKL